ncbi:MAG: hypothetical protein N3D12_00145 [Candidatus Methanomethyliaceae archaeon]|nr:hypothetical protein [Candidatus Methanomethyliaceae archaeon]
MESLTHRPKNHKEWNESYYFVFYDKKQKIGGMTRLGFKPNKEEGMTFLFLFLPDGTVAGYQALEKKRNYPEGRSLRVGSMVHEPLSDDKWKYHFEDKMIVVRNPEDLLKINNNPQLILKVSPVKLDLFFTPINEVYEYSEHMTEESRKVGERSGDAHWEQIATIDGDIIFGEERYQIKDCMGQRDHTHGIREWTHIDYWFYYVIWFSKNLAVNPAAIITNDGRRSIGGFIYKNGRNVPIMDIKIIDQKFRDYLIPISSKLELIDALGNKYILEGRAGPVIPVPFKDEEGNFSVLTQSFGSFKLDGLEGGYGSFETLRKKSE